VRTAEDFNDFYSAVDPWNATRSAFRNRIFRRILSKRVRGQNVLELGSGEGHLTETIFNQARLVTGVDISDVAVARAKARHLTNANFENLDFLRMSFKGYDVIAALECLYYLSPDEQEIFFQKVATEHSGKLLILSGPIIGKGLHRQYFTHTELTAAFDRHRMTVIKYHNLVINRRGLLTTLMAAAARAFPTILDWLPERFIFQRCYMIRII
jgi:SAM-dependent methyltransferase